MAVVAAVFGCSDFFGTFDCLATGTGVFAFAVSANFLTDFFLTDFLAAFFATGFFAAFLAFFTAGLLFLARFFDATALVARARADLGAFFAFFPEVFLLGVATTNSF